MGASGFLGRQILRTALAVVVATAGSAGCARSHGDDSRVTPKVAETISVRVTNHHFLDIAIYALSEGQRTRIGVVGGSSSTVIDLPSRRLGPSQELRLIGDAIGSDEQTTTDLLIVQPGQFIQLTLESSLERSSVGVY